MISDEAYFHLSGDVNKKNMRFYASDPPHMFVEKPISTQKVLVWCAMGKKGIIGPSENHVVLE